MRKNRIEINSKIYGKIVKKRLKSLKIHAEKLENFIRNSEDFQSKNTDKLMLLYIELIDDYVNFSRRWNLTDEEKKDEL